MRLRARDAERATLGAVAPRDAP